MPLTVNVGLSRKSSRDFQSTGVSINMTAELDQSLLAHPDQLQQQVEGLYAQAELALGRKAGEPQSRPAATNQVQSNRLPQNPAPTNGNGNGHSNGNGNGRRPTTSMTVSQRRAIDAIARRMNVDPDQECRDMIGPSLNDLTLRQASELIDHLKSLEPSNGNGGGSNGGGR